MFCYRVVPSLLCCDVEVNVPTLTIPFEIFCHNGTIIILSTRESIFSFVIMFNCKIFIKYYMLWGTFNLTLNHRHRYFHNFGLIFFCRLQHEIELSFWLLYNWWTLAVVCFPIIDKIQAKRIFILVRFIAYKDCNYDMG